MNTQESQPASRFNVLLTEDRDHAPGHWTRQLPRLLQPQGVRAYVARSGREALALLNEIQIHAALIDLATPQDAPGTPGCTPGTPGVAPGSPAVFSFASSGSGAADAQGLWVLEVLRRLPNRPPIVVVNSRAIARIQAQRFLNQALRLGAFTVVNRPSDLEDMLNVIRRLIDRQYEGTWPTN